MGRGLVLSENGGQARHPHPWAWLIPVAAVCVMGFSPGCLQRQRSKSSWNMVNGSSQSLWTPSRQPQQCRHQETLLGMGVLGALQEWLWGAWGAAGSGHGDVVGLRVTGVLQGLSLGVA